MDHRADYAKSGRSNCRGCRSAIGQGELRLAMMVQSNFRDGKDPHWHHFDCFFSKPRGLTSTSLLQGFGELRPEDQARVEKKLGGGAKKGGKGKNKKSSSSSSSKADPATKAFTEQSQRFWKIKDLLESNTDNNYLKTLLEENQVWYKGGEIFTTLLPRVVKLIQFGVPPTCDECKTPNRRLRFNEDTGRWECGATLEYSKCPNARLPSEIQTIPFQFPDFDLEEASKGKRKAAKESLEAFDVCLKELVELAASPSVPVSKPNANGTDERKIFSGWVFAHCREKESELADIRQKVEENGGVWSKTVTKKVSFLLEDPSKYDKKHPMVVKAKKNEVQVVRESFVKHSIMNNAMMDSSKYRLDSRPHGSSSNSATWDSDAEEGKGESIEVIPEGCRVAVHSSAWKELGDRARVLDEGGDAVFHAVLSQADIETGRNAFYKLQVLHVNCNYYVSREYGRTGTTIKNQKLDKHSSRRDAIHEFEALFEEKTGNKWASRKKFVKRPGLFEYVETRLVDPNQTKANVTVHKGSRTLHQRIVDLIELIYDTELMKSAFLEMEIDVEKFPLGALTEAHVEKGYKTLSEISDVLSGKAPSRDDAHRRQQLLALSNKFYHLIPHSFTGAIPLIDSEERLNQKIKLVDTLRDMEVATRLLNQAEEGGDGENKNEKYEADQKYEMLKTNLTPIQVDGKDWKTLDQWVQNTKKLGWNNWNTLKLVDAFVVEREGEKERFDSLGATLDNHKLLWHGSRTTNYCGILSQGLRIAPPEAPCSGYRFGKGVYFADAISKSANYCRTAGTDDMLIMACEVALGTEYEAYRDEYMEKPRPGSHSTHAMGSIVPDPACDLTTFENITVPIGVCKENGIRSSCDANEFIVYDVAQVRIRYLLRLTVNASKQLPITGRVVSPVGQDLTPPRWLRLMDEEPEDEIMQRADSPKRGRDDSNKENEDNSGKANSRPKKTMKKAKDPAKDAAKDAQEEEWKVLAKAGTLAKLLVVDLKAICDANSLPKTGRKADLIARLEALVQ